MSLLFCLLFSACATTTVSYALKENWIDDADLRYAVDHPDKHSWSARLGSPVLIEMRGDTVDYVYNYRAALYKTEREGEEYKPSESDRVTAWSPRLEMISLLMVKDSLVEIRHNAVFNPNEQKKAMEQQEKGSYAWIAVVAILGAALLSALIIALD